MIISDKYMNMMRNPFQISFFHPKFCINRLVGADYYKHKLRISTNLQSWTKSASSEHANKNCTKIARKLRKNCVMWTKVAQNCAALLRTKMRQNCTKNCAQDTSRPILYMFHYSTAVRRRNRDPLRQIIDPDMNSD